MTGAGISTSCGIPDFRSKGTGFYDLLSSLPIAELVNEPQEIFDINIFRSEPFIFYNVAELIYKTFDVIQPSHAHLFIAWLYNRGQLLRCYTQNLDNLERMAGIPNDKLIHCHGNLATATCLECGASFPIHGFLDDIRAKKVIRCVQTRKGKGNNSKKKRKTEEDLQPGVCNGLIKPDVVFFHENLPAIFDQTLPKDLAETDLIIVMGSSMRVAPVSKIPLLVPGPVPTIVINLEPLSHIHPIAQFIGPADDVTRWIMQTLDENTGKYPPSPFLTQGNVFSFPPTFSHSTSLTKIDVKSGEEGRILTNGTQEQTTAPIVPTVVNFVSSSAILSSSSTFSSSSVQSPTVLGATNESATKGDITRSRSGRVIKRSRSVVSYLELESQYLE